MGIYNFLTSFAPSSVGSWDDLFAQKAADTPYEVTRPEVMDIGAVRDSLPGEGAQDIGGGFTSYAGRIYDRLGGNWLDDPQLQGSATSRAPMEEVAFAPKPDVWETLKQGATDLNGWLKGHEDLLKWGVGGLGGLASYLSAQQYNKLAQQARAQLAAEKAKKEAIAKQMGLSRDFTLARTRNESPTYTPGSESTYFANNALSANPSVLRDVTAAEGGGTQQLLARALMQRRASPLSALSSQMPSPRFSSNIESGVSQPGLPRKFADGGASAAQPSQRQLEEALARREAIRQLMLEQAASQAAENRGIAPASSMTPAARRLVESEFPPPRRAEGGYMGGGTSGQSDKIPAMLSDGEYVMDADTVSSLGDGNNAAGAAALDQMRQNIRKHKRSAPVSKIPPKAKAPAQYLKGAK